MTEDEKKGEKGFDVEGLLLWVTLDGDLSSPRFFSIHPISSR